MGVWGEGIHVPDLTSGVGKLTMAGAGWSNIDQFVIAAQWYTNTLNCTHITTFIASCDNPGGLSIRAYSRFRGLRPNPESALS